MVYSLISHNGKNGAADSSTTDPIDTTGANLIVVGVSWYMQNTPTVTISDSKGNTWIPLTAHNDGSATVKCQLFYCFNPTVGSGHTFTASGITTYSSICVQAFSGAAASPFDQENGNFNSSSGTSLNTGSVTPTEDNELLVALVTTLETTHTIDSSFTVSDQVDHGAAWFGIGMAYKIQTTLGAVNPTWSWTPTSIAATAIATFKAAAGAAFKSAWARNANQAIYPMR